MPTALSYNKKYRCALFNPAFIILSTQLLLKAMPPCMGSWTWHNQTFLRASNQLWFYPPVTVPVIILKSELSNFNNIFLQVAVIMSFPFQAFYRLNQEWICDTRILLGLTGSECSWRRWKTTHDPMCWAMEAGDSPWLLLQNAEETIHCKCTFLRTWFSFPCGCLYSLMLPFSSAEVFLGYWIWYAIFSVTVIPQLNFAGMTNQCFSEIQNNLKAFFPSVSKTLINMNFLFFLKLESNTAMISE